MRSVSGSHRIDGAEIGGMGGGVQTNPTIPPMKDALKTIALTVVAILIAQAVVNKTPVGKFVS